MDEKPGVLIAFAVIIALAVIGCILWPSYLSGFVRNSDGGPSRFSLISTAEDIIETVLHEKVSISWNNDDTEVQSFLLHYTLRSDNAKIGTSVRNEVYIAFEFKNSEYKTNVLNKLEINGVKYK